MNFHFTLDQQQQLFIREEWMLQSCRSHKDDRVRLGIDGDALSRWCVGSQHDVSKMDWKAVNGGVMLKAYRAGHFTWLLRPRGCSVRPESVWGGQVDVLRLHGAAKPWTRRNYWVHRQHGCNLKEKHNRKAFLFSKNWFQIHYCP